IIFHFSSNLRSGLAGLIYKKTLLLNITAQSNIDTGRLISLLSADTNQIAMMFPMFFYLIVLPLQIFIPFGFVCYDWGASAVISFAVIVVSIPFQIIISGILATSMKSYLAHNDERNKVTNETMQGMRVVKYSGLEQVFLERVEFARAKQLQDVFAFTIALQLMVSIMRCTPLYVNVATMSVFINVKSIAQTDFAVRVQPNIGFLTQMTQPFSMLPMFIQAGSMVIISQTRVRDFLILPELKIVEQIKPEDEQLDVEVRNGVFVWGDPPEIPLSMVEKQELKKESGRRKKEAAKQAAIKAKQEKKRKNQEKESNDNVEINNDKGKENGSVIHSPQPDSGNEAEDSNSQSSNVTVFSDKQKNEPNIESSQSPSPVVSPDNSDSLSPSPTPSPSSSQSPASSPTPSPKPGEHKKPTLFDINFRLLKGSLTMVIGGVGSGKSSLGAALIGDIEKRDGEIRIKGQIAYCSQTVWINNNTVKGNITFGNTYDEEKYKDVVRICALEPDFQTLAAGDMTAIGEKGVNLSGGQKARIQLARAVYSDRDIYILDDPLSAVDAHVGRILFEECIDGRLKGKTRMLMTNQLHQEI
ncbi:MAG: putative ABC transporter C family member 3, partial [Streblomastix strix]